MLRIYGSSKRMTGLFLRGEVCDNSAEVGDVMMINVAILVAVVMMTMMMMMMSVMMMSMTMVDGVELTTRGEGLICWGLGYG